MRRSVGRGCSVEQGTKQVMSYGSATRTEKNEPRGKKPKQARAHRDASAPPIAAFGVGGPYPVKLTSSAPRHRSGRVRVPSTLARPHSLHDHHVPPRHSRGRALNADNPSTASPAARTTTGSLGVICTWATSAAASARAWPAYYAARLHEQRVALVGAEDGRARESDAAGPAAVARTHPG